MAIVFYHNPRCSTSRRALVMLEEKGIAPTIVRYLDSPPSTAELKRLLAMLGMRPRQLLRTKEKPYTELGLGDPAVDDDAIVDAMARHPILIERPIAVSGNRAVLGRPPERVLDLL